MSDKLLTEHHLEFLSSKGGFTGSSESTLVKIPHCWKSHDAAHLLLLQLFCVWSLFCYALLRVLVNFAIILMRVRELVALLKLGQKFFIS